MADAQILIVEDDLIVARDIENMLKSLGYAAPVVTSSGEEALQKAAKMRPDLVLMDIKLKGDMDGVEAAEEIRARFNIPVVYLTAYADDEILQRAKITDPFGYILKPFVVGELRNTIGMALYRHEMDKRLKESEKKYRTILDNIEDGYFEVDIAGNLTFFNDSLCRIIGYSRDEVMGMNNRQYMDADAAKKVFQAFNRVYTTGKPTKGFDWELIREDGTKRFVEASVSLMRNSKGERIGFRGIARDITERKRAEEALRKSEALFHSLIESLPQNVFSKDLEGRFTFANQRYCTTEGKSLEDVLGKTDFDLHPHELAKKYREDDRWVIETEQIFEAVEEHQPMGGERFYVQVIKTPVYDSEGQVTGILGVFWDITERKRAEEQLKASLQEKEVLLKEIHHRVKNNLQVVSSLLHLQSEYIEDQQSLDIFKESQNRVKSMALVHEQLYQSKDLARIDFAEYVRTLVAYLFRSYGVNPGAIALKVNVDDVLLGVDTAIPCGLIINELVSNALKHAFPAGREGEICIELYADDELTLIISNNGVSFPENLDFCNTESLGLRLVSTLTRQLEGTIELDRSGGTTFKITFARPKH